jgi:hypothetical protein
LNNLWRGCILRAWLKHLAYLAPLPMNGNGNTRVPAGIFHQRCFSIQMGSAAHDVEIVRTLLKLCVHLAQQLQHAVHMPSQSKSLMEFGAAFQKMID